MADFNQVVTPGNYQDGEITVVVEIPAGSNHKIEWDRKVGVMRLDRVDPVPGIGLISWRPLGT